MQEEFDRIEDMEAKETAHTLPLIFHILFWGLILWGIYYAVSYIPAFSGWSQQAEYEASLEK
jgi:choline-glycine betaine transporter